jgi:Chaperone of endosialidase
MGGGGKGGSSVSSVQIPPEVLARYNAVNARAETVAQTPYQAYSQDPNAFVAPLTQTQQAGIQNTNAMAGAAQPYYGAATQQLMQAQQGAQPAMGAAYQNLGQAQDVGQQYANQARQYYGQAQNAAQPYYGSATAGTQNALQAGQAFMPGAALGALAGGQAVNAGQLQTEQYMSPYTKNVVEATQNALQQQFGQQNAEQQAQAIKAGAFGGDRAGLQRAALRGQQALAQSQAISPLYQQAYNQALQTAQQQQGVGLGAAQANRAAMSQMGQQLAALGQQGYGQQLGAAQQMQGLGKDIYGQNLQTGQALQGLGQQQFGQGTGVAQQLAALGQQGYGMGAGTSQALANLGAGAQAAGLAGAQAQIGAGATEQQTQQAGLQAMYNQFMQEKGYPFQIAQFLANIAEGTGALSGNTTTTSMASDRRLKENVKKVGETNDGQPIYRYNFKGDPRTQIGLMAQEVEKDHPEAVDEDRGYKSVDYKKATEDAIHKDDGGEVSGMERYSMAAPSNMLQKSGGLGALTLPQMRTGSDIAIKPGVNAAELAAMRAPKATGLSPGTLEAAQAQYASLGGVDPQAGQGYKDFEMKRLSDFLAQHGAGVPSYGSSQGGLVGAEGGAFSRGGYANDGYVNPALQFYGPQGAKGGFDSSGPYGATLSPAQARQLLQGTKPPEDRRPSGVQQAKDIGSLGVMAGGAWKERPDFMRSDEDLAKRAEAARVSEAEDFMTLKKAEELGFGKSHGGMAEGRHHYANMGYVNPGSGPYGSDDENSLGAILTQPQQRHELLKPNERRQMPQESGLSKALQVGSLGLGAMNAAKYGKAGVDWLGAKLGADAAGETALGSAVGDSVGVAPGLGAAVPEAAAAAVPEAAAAAVPEVLAGAGEAAAIAPELMAAAEIPEWLLIAGLPFGVKRGGAIPRRHFDGSDGSFVTPPRADRFTGADTGEAMSEEDMAALKELALKTTVPQNAPKLERAPKPAEAPTEAPAKPAARTAVGEVGAGRAPYSHFMSQLLPESMGSGTKSALTSENLWVPLLSGIAAAGASRAPTHGQALSEGLLGATTAYTGLQKQQSGTDLARAQERKAIGEAAKGSIEYNKEGFPTAVFVPDGYGGMKRIPFLEAYRNRDRLNLLPQTLSEIESIAQSRPEVLKEPGTTSVKTETIKEPVAPKPPAASTTQKTTQTAPTAVEEPPARQTGAIITSNEGGDYRYAVEPKKNGAADKYFSSEGAFKNVNLQDPMEVQTVIQSNQKLSERSKKDEEIAENIRKQIPTINRNMEDLWTLSSSINKVGDKGLTQRGAGQESRAALANLYNTAVRVMGVPNMQNIDANSDITQAEIIKKIQSLSSPQIAQTAGFHAAGIADAIRSAMPSGNLTLDAANTILSSMYSEMQKMRDFNKYYDAQTRRYGSGLNAYDNFNNDMAGVYATEKEAIKKAMIAHDVVSKGGEKYRQSYADVVRKDPRAAAKMDEMFKSPGFARYWSGS